MICVTQTDIRLVFPARAFADLEHLPNPEAPDLILEIDKVGAFRLEDFAALIITRKVICCMKTT